MLYPGHSLGRSYPSAEVQSVYSTAPADWANHFILKIISSKFLPSPAIHSPWSFTLKVSCVLLAIVSGTSAISYWIMLYKNKMRHWRLKPDRQSPEVAGLQEGIDLWGRALVERISIECLYSLPARLCEPRLCKPHFGRFYPFYREGVKPPKMRCPVYGANLFRFWGSSCEALGYFMPLLHCLYSQFHLDVH